MKNKDRILFCFFLLFSFAAGSQNNTSFTPYSRYGLGLLVPPTFAHNAAMGGAYVALKPDSTMPVFINAGNPASYALIRVTSLELGAKFLYSNFVSGNSPAKKWGANFSYASLGFPIGRNGGACVGVLPYSTVGYDTEGTQNELNIGDVTYKFNGAGGINKVFAGYGVMPFSKRLGKYRQRHLFVPDSMRRLTHGQYMRREFGSKLLNDLSVGFNINYLFGNITHTTRIIYPNPFLYNNTYRERSLTLRSPTGNFGLQTAIGIDSVRRHGKKVALKEKVKITLGYFMNLNTTMPANYSTVAYNYILTFGGLEVIRDTAMYKVGQRSTVKLPLEQGFGIGFKKGERLNLVADFAITGWEDFSFLEEATTLKNNYRVALGANFVPEKYAAGRNAFWKRMNYRLGGSYQTGSIEINKSLISDAFVSGGLGIPVGGGRVSSMVNFSAQYGVMGTTADGLLRETYWRLLLGFTFSDRWFQKFRHD